MAEEYVELYKKYRPKTWDELIGQKKVARSFQNAVIKDKLPTLYLLSGPRGTGKTTCSLLLAKSVNCEHVDEQGNPCNECETCIAIDNGTQVGVNYISMANHGSVDDVREIMKQAQISQPIKKTVYILDEIHNLSKAAFDSLLIPMENLKNVLFIGATTEINKVPQTILSRAQLRKLSTIPQGEMVKHLEKIVELEELNVNDDTIVEAVKQGRGSVRDSLSALDALISMEEDGSDAKDYGVELIRSLSSGNISNCFSTVAEAVNDGEDPRDMAEQLFSDMRDLLLTASGVDENLVGTLPLDDVGSIIKKLYGKRGILIISEEVGEAINRMTIGVDTRIVLEIALVNSLSRLGKLKKFLLNRQKAKE